MSDDWYSGLRAVERRTVTGEDASIIDDLRNDRLFQLAFAAAGPLLLLALGVVIAFLMGRGEPIALASTGAVALAMALRPWRTVPACARQYAALGRDLDGGEVLVCRGLGRDLVFAWSPAQRLEPAALAGGSSDATLEVEVLSESGAILRINGARVRSWSQTERGATAEKPEHARLAAQFVAPHPEAAGVAVGERPLSAEELAELFEHATPLAAVDIALLASLALLVVVSWWHAVASRATNLVLPILSAAVFVPVAIRALRRWRISRRFSGDLRDGRVAIVSYENGSSIIEFLPRSGAVWSENHIAAPWRRLPLLRRTFGLRRR